MAKWHNVKSFEKETANYHEKGKDYLSDSEMKTFFGSFQKKQDIQKEIMCY